MSTSGFHRGQPLCMIFVLVFLLLFFPSQSAAGSVTETSGDILSVGLPLAAAISAWYQDQTRGLVQFGLAYTTVLVSTAVLKVTTRKQRPNGVCCLAFPSGHTASAFSGATALFKQWGWQWGIPAYLLAAYVGYTRIHAHKHDVVDVMGGLVVGIGITVHFSPW